MAISAEFNTTSLFSHGDDFQSRPVTIKSGAAYVRGTMLGNITASDKYQIAIAAAVDGSQVPSMVLAYDVDATAADVVAQAYGEGSFVAELLTLGAGHTIASVEKALRLANSSIYLKTGGLVP